MAASIRLGDLLRSGRLFLVAGCGLAAGACERANAPGAELNTVVQANSLLEAAEENAAALAQDEELANQAAADEAADMDVFGGNAAAGETANSAPELTADNDTAS